MSIIVSAASATNELKSWAEWKQRNPNPIPRCTPTYSESVVAAAKLENLPEGELTATPFKKKYGVRCLTLVFPNGEEVTVTVPTAVLRDVTERVKGVLSKNDHPLVVDLNTGSTVWELEGKSTFAFNGGNGDGIKGQVMYVSTFHRVVSPRCIQTYLL
jgi:hypothetical protein